MRAEAGPYGLVFNIQRFAIHDGPGIRTTLFLKGCPLGCWWCHNPESLAPRPHLVFFPEKCIDCGNCYEVCPHGVHARETDGSRVLSRERCEACGRCVEGCDAGALVMEGRRISVAEAMDELRKDAAFYRNSGGGITLSGGEPMSQADFSAAVLESARGEGFHTALDTSGYAAWDDFEKVLPFVDLVLYDFKLADSGEHRAYTGVPNELIRENLSRLDARGVPIEIRIPVIPGINDNRRNMEASARFLAGFSHIQEVVLLPYHGGGESKYPRIGRAFRLEGVVSPPRESMEEIVGWMAGHGLRVHAR